MLMSLVGNLFGAFSGVLGVSCGLPGASWEPLGASWELLGAERSKCPFGLPVKARFWSRLGGQLG
eukprot:3505805-Pyramimonas_sp.AAC.1